MSLEIERKFLVNPSLLPGCLQGIQIAQGYLNSSPERTVRIRSAGKKAFITVKGPSTPDGLSRYEWEREIPVEDVFLLFGVCESGAIAKVRKYMVYRRKLWEIDFFQGANRGLVVAEIELSSEDEKVDIPPWCTKEVTGDVKYYNSYLAKHPYTTW